MKWMILLLVAICGVAYFVNPHAPPASGSKTPADTDLLPVGSNWNIPLFGSSYQKSIRTLADHVLQPLESERIVTTESAQKALDQLRTQVASNQHPDPRLGQALVLLNQVIQEREATMKRITRGASRSGSTLDKVPGDWHVVGKPSQKVDLSAMNTRWRNSYWATTELKKWHQRSDEYRASIESLLAPTPPPR